jgi:NADPH2:quinone reductase
VIGGGSSVGKFAIQYAELASIGTVIAIASAARTEELKKLGATHVIDRHTSDEEIQQVVKEITGEEGVENIYDYVSWD